MNNRLIWMCYISGALLTLAWKLGRYCYADKKAGKNIKDSICEWFFANSADNTASWVTTIGAVWIVGSIYINDLSLFNLSLPLPADYSIAFFLGGVMELVAPNIAKWGVQKITAMFDSKLKG